MKSYKEQYQMRKARRLSAENFNVYGIIVGETYGNYEVMEKIKVPQKVSKGNGKYVECMATKWRCRYIPTGEEKIITTGYLSEFKSKSLQDKEIEKLVNDNQHQKGFRNYLFRSSKTNANKRSYSFELTQEEYENIITQNCYYCGEAPKQMSEKLIKTRGTVKEPPFSYNGIDRINNDIGYTKENCVPCCSMCNYMKKNYSLDIFLKQIKKINRHLNLDKNDDE